MRTRIIFINSAGGWRWLVSLHHEPRLLDQDYHGRSRRIIDDRSWCGLLAGWSLPVSSGDGVPILWSHFGTRFIVCSRAKWTLCGGKRASGSPPPSRPKHPPTSSTIPAHFLLHYDGSDGNFFRVFRDRWPFFSSHNQYSLHKKHIKVRQKRTVLALRLGDMFIHNVQR